MRGLLLLTGRDRDVKQGVDIQRDEEAFQQVLYDDLIETLCTQQHYVTDIMQVVQVFSYKWLKLAANEMTMHAHEWAGKGGDTAAE